MNLIGIETREVIPVHEFQIVSKFRNEISTGFNLAAKRSDEGTQRAVKSKIWNSNLNKNQIK